MATMTTGQWKGSKKPKPEWRYYECICSGTIHHGPYGLEVECCGRSVCLGTGDFKKTSKAKYKSWHKTTSGGYGVDKEEMGWYKTRQTTITNEVERDSARAEQELAKLLLKKKR
jgi:hypothetical protein